MQTLWLLYLDCHQLLCTCIAGDAVSSTGWGRFPWRRVWLPTPVFLPGKCHRKRSLVGYSPQGHKELDRIEWLNHHSLVIWIMNQFNLELTQCIIDISWQVYYSSHFYLEFFLKFFFVVRKISLIGKLITLILVLFKHWFQFGWI